MLNFFPGIFQLEHRKYFQGACLFTATVLSALFLLRVSFFSDSFPGYIAFAVPAAVLAVSILWHLFFMVDIKTSVLNVRESPENLYEKGRMAFLKQNFELAEICFRNLLRLKPDDEDAVYQMGKTLIRINKTGEARDLFKKYLEGKSKKWRNEIEDLYEEILR